jgi:hypothetical protein
MVGVNMIKYSNAWTLKSMYDNNSIAVYCEDESKEYRIKASELLKIINQHCFVERKARKHVYLEVLK